MANAASVAETPKQETALFKRILVALDASNHANRALEEALRLAGTSNGVITGIHAYAAQLHDRRFRQMEGGLPERYLEEDEMEHQREVHDDLISRGLNIISDSYHDAAECACAKDGRPYRRLSPEGKNYRRIVEAIDDGDFTMLAMGSLGLGNVPGSLIGGFCERVARRCAIDALVIRDPQVAIGDGPIVVGLDGSPRSFGALMTGFEIARRLNAEVHAVAAYDPYYHYVAFNKIAGVLSDEAGKVFRFKEQEKLHEELIDDGLAKIYQSHLEVAGSMAEEQGVELTLELVDGKPFRAIADYLEKVKASLLIVGKTGVHADDMLDIGGNSENLLRMAPCHVWLGQTTYTPPLDVVAEETMTWSNEAEELLNRAPEFARPMARTAVLRLAQESGHTFITKNMVEETAAKLMPGGDCPHANKKKELAWSGQASALIEGMDDKAQAGNIRLRAEKSALREGAGTVQAQHVRKFLEGGPDELPWGAAALARLQRVPEPMRGAARARIEDAARERGADEVTLDIVEAGLEAARAAMQKAMSGGGHKGS
ncbi:MAG TPA: universal stress protein UspA [Rhodospirillales bacterium]|nr:universal stress protein UspA [Rhodospirillales bacterium]